MKKLYLNIGAMKAGTTWLYANLSKHPELYFTYEKELHYFSHVNSEENHLNESYRFGRFMNAMNKIEPEVTPRVTSQKKIRWYADYMMNPDAKGWYENLFKGASNDQFCADFSNHYATLSKEGWEHVKKTAEDVKISYVLRHPIERLWSHVKFHAQQTGQAEAFNSRSQAEHLEFAKKRYVWRNGEYASTISRLRNQFDEKDFTVLFFDDIHQSPEKSLASIENLLGIGKGEYSDWDLNRKINVSGTTLMPAFFPALFQRELDEEIRALETMGYSVPLSWQEPIETHPEETLPLSSSEPETKQSLTQKLKGIARKLI